MTKNRTLPELHQRLTQRLYALIEKSDVDPKVLDSAIRFLKDNGISKDL